MIVPSRVFGPGYVINRRVGRRNRLDTSSERADWTIEFWVARAVRFNGANRSGFRPIIDSVSDMAASLVHACVCASCIRPHCARYEALFFAIAMADPTHRRKVQLESATRPEIIGEHSRENVTHQLVASLPSSVPFLRRSSLSLCHVTVHIFLSLELLIVMLLKIKLQ